MYVAILAGTTSEANAHAKRQGLKRASYRYAAKAATVRKLHVSEIHILPGFAKRLDRHAILAEFRYTKGERKSFDEPRGYVDLETAWRLAHAEQLERLNAGRLTEAEALEEAYVTNPIEPPEWAKPMSKVKPVRQSEPVSRVSRRELQQHEIVKATATKPVLEGWV